MSFPDHRNSRRDRHAGHFLEKISSVIPLKLSGRELLYLFSKPLNWLDFAPSYPEEPRNLGDYIRKWRMDKGLSIKDFARLLNVTEDTVINWELRRIRPREKRMESLKSIMHQVLDSLFGYRNKESK